MNILSLFDGMSCGQLALERAGIKVDGYFASEIDKYAIAVTQFNFPRTVQLGDITKWEDWSLPKIDLIIGGSPCQGFSHAGKGLNFNDPRSRLFFEFINILNALNPRYFLLENVRMKKEWVDIITNYVGIEPILINSALVSAQNRNRYYWTNIPVEQPKDRHIYLKDILLPDADEPSLSNVYGGFKETEPRVHYGKSPTLRPSTGGGHVASVVNREKVEDYRGARVVGRRINPKTGHRDDYNKDIPLEQYVEARSDKKTNCLSTVQKDSLVLSKKAIEFMNKKVTDGRTHFDFKHHSDIKNDKSACVTANFYKGIPYNVLVDEKLIRKFHPIECERLQTVPDNYTQRGYFVDTHEISSGEIKKISNTQRYKMLGNGFTVEVIAHILKDIKNK